MTWYAVYQISDGKLTSTSSTDPSAGLPAGLAAKDVGETRPFGQWNTSTLVFDPMPATRHIPVRDFMQRFTAAEYMAIEDDTDATTRFLMTQLRAGGDVHLDSANLIAGMDHCVARGHITSARKDAILA